MIITPLGHTEFLVDIANSESANIRILIDTWFSDYIVGDLMERSTKIQLDPEKLSSIDAIYISHAHTDHLDPYTLIQIYKYADPLLILPITLRFLAPIFAEFLPTARIHWLHNHETLNIGGIEFTGYIFAQSDITNEDDVMMISIASDTELLFAEIDTVPDEYEEEIQSELFRIFDRKPYQTRCYLASRNELEGQLSIYDFNSNKRKSFRSEYIAGRKEEIRASYEKFEYEEYVDMDNIMTLSGFVRGYIGQGLQYPISLSPVLSELAIFPLDEIASMEADIAHTFGYDFAQKALLPGRQYRVEKGTIEAGRKECPIGEIGVPSSRHPEVLYTLGPIGLRHRKVGSDLVSDTGLLRASQGQIPQTQQQQARIYANGPLMPREMSSDELDISKAKICNVLNQRFLPYWSATPVASLRSALIKNKDGAYRIGFRVSATLRYEAIQKPKNESLSVTGLLPSSQGQEQWIIFEYSFASSAFQEVPYSPEMRIDEDYYLLDIVDFLEGRQELYSNFWHTLDPKRVYRLWTCLGANFMNNDLLLAKYRLHFERARNSETVHDFVESIIMNVGK